MTSIPVLGQPPLGRSRSRGQAAAEFALVAPLLFLLLLGIFEGGRYILFAEMLNHATREGARYAIVHGADSTCPSGPMPGGATNPCDPAGERIKESVRVAALSLASTGALFAHEPVWTPAGTQYPPQPGDTSTGHNGRGEHVSVFVDFTYAPIFKQIMDVPFIPTITISAESSLVINN